MRQDKSRISASPATSSKQVSRTLDVSCPPAVYPLAFLYTTSSHPAFIACSITCSLPLPLHRLH